MLKDPRLCVSLNSRLESNTEEEKEKLGVPGALEGAGLRDRLDVVVEVPAWHARSDQLVLRRARI